MQKMRQVDQFHTTFFFKKRTKYQVKATGLQLTSIYFDSLQLGIHERSRDMLNIKFPEKGLGLVSPPHLCNIFQEKYILLKDQTSLPDCPDFSKYLTTSVLKLFVNQGVGCKI